MTAKIKCKIREIDLASNLRNQLNRPRRYRDIHLFEKLSKLEKILGIRKGSYVAKDDSPPEIPISADKFPRHQFAKYVRKRSPIETADLAAILKKVSFDIYLHESGAIPAAINSATDYTAHSWTRDTAIIAYAMAVSKHNEEAKKAIYSLAVFYGRKEQRDRFISFHYDGDPYSKYRFANPTLELPHVRARIDDKGDLIESPQDWSHSQLDAIGMWLFTSFRMANLGLLDLDELNHHLTITINSDNALDPILSVGLKFMNRIRFWQQHDHGPWEDRLEPSRASSLGIGVAALCEARKYFERFGCPAELMAEIENALHQAEKMLEFRIPKTGHYAVETEAYPADSALAFLLFPFNPGFSLNQEKAVLMSLYKSRMGEIGFTRRDRDEYLGQDYIYNPDSSAFCNPDQPFYRAAQWTLFDPLIAGYYYNRYLKSNALDEESFLMADRHLKRTLLLITSSRDSYRKANPGVTVKTGRGRLPEAYFYDSKIDKWRPNENTPLLMAEAAFVLMLDRAREACKLFELSRGK